MALVSSSGVIPYRLKFASVIAITNQSSVVQYSQKGDKLCEIYDVPASYFATSVTPFTIASTRIEMSGDRSAVEQRKDDFTCKITSKGILGHHIHFLCNLPSILEFSG